MKNKTNVWRKKEKTLTHAGVFKTITAKEIFLIAGHRVYLFYYLEYCNFI